MQKLAVNQTTEWDKVKTLIRHIENVKDNMLLLAEKTMEQGNSSLSRQLLGRAYRHDNSKFFGVEWEGLIKDSKMLDVAIRNHRELNDHHPEYWGGVDNMPEVCLIEMVCDCKARSEEFGTDFLEWFDRLDCTTSVRNTIYYWCELLLERPW